MPQSPTVTVTNAEVSQGQAVVHVRGIGSDRWAVEAFPTDLPASPVIGAPVPAVRLPAPLAAMHRTEPLFSVEVDGYDKALSIASTAVIDLDAAFKLRSDAEARVRAVAEKAAQAAGR